jgi:negative regulator of replication initiation
MAVIEVDNDTKRTVAFAAEMAGVSEGEIVRRLVAASTTRQESPNAESRGRPIYADYAGHRTRALYFSPSRVEIIDGPLKGISYKTPTGAARAVVRQYNSKVNDNRNGWGFWQLDQDGPRAWLQSIRPNGTDD